MINVQYYDNCERLKLHKTFLSPLIVDQPRTILEKLKYEVGKGLRF